MRTNELKKLIKECIQEVVKEEFGDTGCMRAVNVREGKDTESKQVGAYGSAAFFESEPNVVTFLNNMGHGINVTVKKFGLSVYVQIDG